MKLRAPCAFSWCAAVSLLLAACGGAAASPSTPAASSAASVVAAKPAPASSAAKPSATSAAASAKPAASGAAAAAPIKLRAMELTPVPDPMLSYNQMAQDLGLFQKHGLDVEILKAGGGGPAKVQTIVANSADIATTDVVSMYGGISQGAAIQALFVPAANYGTAVIAQKQYTTVAQLKGKQLATPSLEGAGRFLASIAFQHFGVKDSDIKWLAISGTSQELAAVLAGRVAGATLGQTAIPLVQDGPNAQQINILIPSTTAYTPTWPNFEFIAQKQWLQKNPEAARRYVATMLDMARTLAKDQQAYSRVAHQVFPPMSEAQAAKLWTLLSDAHYWPVNGGVNIAAAQGALGTFFKVRKQQPNHYLAKAADAFDTGPLKSVLDQAGVLSGASDVPDWYKK
ncbi:MAG TPA: ABC transporter substrate-binding protein [Chloroflexota bacterium]|nr:ABC transporter substrate-binding protein [Chloroflexota bacterium]